MEETVQPTNWALGLVLPPRVICNLMVQLDKFTWFLGVPWRTSTEVVLPVALGFVPRFLGSEYLLDHTQPCLDYPVMIIKCSLQIRHIGRLATTGNAEQLSQDTVIRVIQKLSTGDVAPW